MVLGFGEMMEEDQPEPEIWLDEVALGKHFEERRKARAEKYGTADKDDEGGRDWMSNDLADEMLRNVGVTTT